MNCPSLGRGVDIINEPAPIIRSVREQLATHTIVSADKGGILLGQELDSHQQCMMCQQKRSECGEGCVYYSWSCSRGPEKGRPRVLCMDCIFEAIDELAIKRLAAQDCARAD